MGSGVKANILSTLTAKILSTMLELGAPLEECVETIAKTLPISEERDIAYSTFAILSVHPDGQAILIEYDTPRSIFIHEGRPLEHEFTERVLSGKKIRDYRFTMGPQDSVVMMSDGITHAGLGKKEYSFGWGRTRVSEYVGSLFAGQNITSARITSALLGRALDLYDKKAGDDSTVVTARALQRRDLNIFTGPPSRKEDDEKIVREFLAAPGIHVISGGTSATIAARVLGKTLVPSLLYADPEIPPIASLEGLDLVTEGVLTLNRAISLMKTFNEGKFGMEFYEKLDSENGGSRIAKLIIEEATHIHLFVGKAMNPAYQAKELPFDLSIRMRLVEKIMEEGQKMGKVMSVTYY